MHKLILIIFLFSVGGVFSQSIENVDFRAEGKKILIRYDLLCKNQDTLCNVKLVFKNEQGQIVSPITVNGDLNLVEPGENKTILWDVIADGLVLSGKYSAQISFKNVLIVKFNYSQSVFCQSDIKLYTPNIFGSGIFRGGSFSSTPEGLYIDKTTGAINPNSSKSGNYSIIYTTKNSLEYPTISSKFNLSIYPNPLITGATLCAVNETIQLKCADDSRNTFIWSSENQNLATVSSSGIVTGIKQGEATIKFTNFLGCEQKISIQITAYPSVKIDMKYDCKCDKQNCYCQIIKSQIWMTKNLDLSNFKNGDKIPQARNFQEWREAGEKERPAWCYYNFNPDNDKVYGKLYNWYAINDKRGLAPMGWHIPKREEWYQLLDALSYNSSKPDYSGHCEKNISSASTALKSKTLWEGDCFGCAGNNSSGFNAVPSGIIINDYYESFFEGIGNKAYYAVFGVGTSDRAATDASGNFIKIKLPDTFILSGGLSNYNYYDWFKVIDKITGVSVRCIKD